MLCSPRVPVLFVEAVDGCGGAEQLWSEMACFEGDLQSDVSGSGWNEGPDLNRGWNLWL